MKESYYVGKKVPYDVEIPYKSETLTSKDYFEGRRVVVFSLPGAYTPTCSSSHLPRYEYLSAAIMNNGIDNIICVSVNDPYVMDAWGKEHNIDIVNFMPDGNGEFTAEMGMLVDKSHLGFGKRSHRYSMVVNNGIIEKIFIESDEDGDPFEVSDADTMLKYLINNNPYDYKYPEDVAIFTREGCPYCEEALNTIVLNGIYDYEELVLNKDYTETTLRAITGKTTTPQVFINGDYIGGSEELYNHLVKSNK